MHPETILVALFAIDEAIKLEPGIAAAIRSMFAQGDPTPADWNALRAKVASKSYKDYVPSTALVDATAPAAAPAPAPTAGNVTAPPAATPAPAPQVFTGQATDPHAAAL